ncbi:hypothetical protein EA462_07320 [Natrarchaeobius halalkaliphilus]|uniref:Uncharacterized protein n=1 Tax=Natrarchaeobius halalkaliphilus TaxID=1679091 RepID=A0A3N6LMP2_9EURY|nr:hypothetical protein [Natrarchaeobius halalkaliphilus]RQG90348.1 hypothetical protein EA462_07320 [Natrarchaeobius halalkaliphilus]
MTDDTDQEVDHDSGADVGHDLEAERTTAPMSEYSARSVAVGFLVLVLGALIAFGIPLATLAA